MPAAPKANTQIKMLGKLTQGAAAKLLGITARSLRDSHDAPRRDDGTYDAAEVVRWWGRRGDRPKMTEADEEIMAIVADLAYEVAPEIMARPLADRLMKLHQQHGAALLTELGDTVLRAVVKRAGVEAAFAPQFDQIERTAIERAREQAARTQAYAQLHVAVVCDGCGKVRRGKRWVKAQPPNGYIVEPGSCPDCEA